MCRSLARGAGGCADVGGGRRDGASPTDVLLRTLLASLACKELPVAKDPRARRIDRVFRPDTDCDATVSCSAWSVPAVGVHRAVRAAARAVSAAHRPPAHLAYQAIPTQAFAPGEAGDEVIRRAQRVVDGGGSPGTRLRLLVGLAWASWRGMDLAKQRSSLDPLHSLLRALSGDSDALTLDPSVRSMLVAEAGSGRRWPEDLSREDAFALARAVADARARSTWAKAGHPDEDPPAGDPREWHARCRAQAPKLLSHAVTRARM